MDQRSQEYSVDSLLELLRTRGADCYDETVTQLAHALQTAYRATLAGAEAESVAAALLHDVGHLLLPEERARRRSVDHDLRHERVGYAVLSSLFPEAVTEPVRLHVEAKRYLTATDPGYRSQLSPGSLHSLELQGGPFTPQQRADFESNPYWREAVALRRWDDEAKVPGLQVPGLEQYAQVLHGCRR